MKNNLLLIWLAILLAVGVGYTSFKLWQVAQAVQPVAAEVSALSGEVKNFKLTDSAGQEFDTSKHQGEVWAVSFFFSSCPQICLRMNQTLAKLQEDPKFAGVKFVSITVDPENDRPSVLAKYAEKFAADPKRWAFLTGDFEAIKEVGKNFGVTVEKEVHSDRVILIDREGKIRGRFRSTDPEQLDLLKKTLSGLVAEPAPQKQ